MPTLIRCKRVGHAGGGTVELTAIFLEEFLLCRLDNLMRTESGARSKGLILCSRNEVVPSQNMLCNTCQACGDAGMCLPGMLSDNLA